ncbi:PhzF family phenazine biosynthesis isomerase [Xanthomonas sp. 3307]|uniref:PhzF family phenazine biosynthesis protein n=1 Tax=Xanthomonas sp. 3307 TaxID=3035316 RepID=UPI001621A8C8|nr:PhzF family phenazine biosynthesis isomerase [Xanthomonas sp. 3307]MBB5944223.1 PhzF family phenazine biosynthesis protein [Xanthomonas sp. 3307]
MQLPLFIVDAFTTVRFRGNPAAVVPLQAWLPDALMQAIASENNLSETAFFVREADGAFAIRWFSPLREVAFCGHATLASAFVVATQGLAPLPLRFRAAAVGELAVDREADGRFVLRFPNQAPTALATVPQELAQALSIAPQAAYRNAQAYIAVYADEAQVRAVVPDLARMLALAPLWAQRLGKQDLRAWQASARGGELDCRVTPDHVQVRGAAVQYLHGSIEL